jgi:hypothetical protein
MLDAYSRRHEAQKIYLRQGAVQRWVGWREQVLQGQRPHTGHTERLAACDAQLRVVSQVQKPPDFGREDKTDLIFRTQELAAITDDSIYSDMRSSDYQMGRWTLEDPSLRHVQRWVRARR